MVAQKSHRAVTENTASNSDSLNQDRDSERQEGRTASNTSWLWNLQDLVTNFMMGGCQGRL